MNILKKVSLIRAAAMMVLLATLVAFLGAQASLTEAAPDVQTINVLAIGDSITYGYEWHRPIAPNDPATIYQQEGYPRAYKGQIYSPEANRRLWYASYRVPLYQLFWLYDKYKTDHQFKFTFIGTVDSEKTYNFAGKIDKDPGYPSQWQDSSCEDGKIENCYPKPSPGQIAFVGEPGMYSENINEEDSDPPEPLYAIEDALTELSEPPDPKKPDVALIHLGTNDVGKKVGRPWSNTEKAFDGILTKLRNDDKGGNKNITVYVAQIIPIAYPGPDYCNKAPTATSFATTCDRFVGDPPHGWTDAAVNTAVEKFNDNLVQKWCGLTPGDVAGKAVVKCEKQSNDDSTVYLVDHYQPFDAEMWLIPSDEVHPNRRGECEIARTWYDALKQTLPDSDLTDAPEDFCDKYNEGWYETPVGECAPVEGNVVDNFCFADGNRPWKFRHFSQQGTFTRSRTDPFAGEFSAEIAIQSPNRNIQLYQHNIQLQPNTTYELSFAAYSSDGRNMSIWLHKHSKPYTNYGLAGQWVNLKPYWQEFTMTFTTPDLADMNNARLRFWFAPYTDAGTVYHIDRVVLRPAP